MATLGFFRESL